MLRPQHWLTPIPCSCAWNRAKQKLRPRVGEKWTWGITNSSAHGSKSAWAPLGASQARPYPRAGVSRPSQGQPRAALGRRGRGAPRMRSRGAPQPAVRPWRPAAALQRSAAPRPAGRLPEQDGGASAAAAEPGGSQRRAVSAARRRPGPQVSPEGVRRAGGGRRGRLEPALPASPHPNPLP